MRKGQRALGAFQKVGECVYRYSSNGVYYARVRADGKEVRRSLGITDPAFARRKLADFRKQRPEIDHSQSKLTLSEFCDRFLKAVQYQTPKTVERKIFIVRRITNDTGNLTQVAKIRASDCDLWFARYSFGSASRNLNISCLKELFDLAVRYRFLCQRIVTFRHKTTAGFAVPLYPQVRPLL